MAVKRKPVQQNAKKLTPEEREYERWRQDMIYQVWGPQPEPEHRPIRTSSNIKSLDK